MKNKDLTVIILSHNTKNITDECLKRVKVASEYCEKVLKNRVETIVVDNASIDKSTDLIRAKYPWVNLLAQKENVGFAKGNNIGASFAKGEFILLLNSDAFLEKDTLSKAIQYLSSRPLCEVLQIKFKNADGSFQPVGGYLPTPIKTIFWLLGFENLPLIKNIIHPIYIYNRKYFEKERRLEWSSAAFFLMRKKVYDVTHGFDERYFLYMEDVDLCKKIRNKGFQIIYTPDISIVHLSGASSKKEEEKNKLKHQLKGLLLYHKIHYPKSFALIKRIVIFGVFIRTLFYLIIGNIKIAKSYFNAGRFLLY
ncbi:MAG: Glycosyltransferase [Microgenomates group bacterium GW2011_GWC1_37_8]|uniref:Glycosyltransferase n=1 Tax=Candidatus Woesebacteria bacterium GW2011_GWB1_38_8 TaxID=1618570 RepID=A0A0G0L1U8_9BACT|nr:MAG: Glycosyltransferase [Microgenomates group bacterium GW2011_GWC1_37_8]KKQ85953.1 MAG: Glycosyltransferase [Candidatus Woesebacteria bacterium GW2011_GWB1_38_8]